MAKIKCRERREGGKEGRKEERNGGRKGEREERKEREKEERIRKRKEGRKKKKRKEEGQCAIYRRLPVNECEKNVRFRKLTILQTLVK